MPANADDQPPRNSSSSTSAPDPVDEALRSEARPAPEPAEPPVLSGKGMLRKGFLRWLLRGMIRVIYRQWTRIAVRLSRKIRAAPPSPPASASSFPTGSI